LVELILQRAGMTVVCAENGKIAIEKATSETFDLILMDMQMPVMDGYTAVAKLRESGATLPIVALTANAMKGYEDKLLSAGFSHYISKPIDLDAMIRMLGDVLMDGATDVPSSDDNQIRDVSVDSEDRAATQLEVPEDGPIGNALAASDPRFAKIAEQFIERLHLQIDQMNTALNNGDFAGLAKLGHWLKGSGGTVGYQVMSAPGAELEKAGKAEDEKDAAAALDMIESLAMRLIVSQDEPNCDESPASTCKRAVLLDTSNKQAHRSAADNLHVQDALVPIDGHANVSSGYHGNNFCEHLAVLKRLVAASDYSQVSSQAKELALAASSGRYDCIVYAVRKLQNSALEKDDVGMRLYLRSLHEYHDQFHESDDTALRVSNG